MRKKLIFPQGEGDEIIQISPDGWFLLPSPFGGGEGQGEGDEISEKYRL